MILVNHLLFLLIQLIVVPNHSQTVKEICVPLFKGPGEYSCSIDSRTDLELECNLIKAINTCEVKNKNPITVSGAVTKINFEIKLSVEEYQENYHVFLKKKNTNDILESLNLKYYHQYKAKPSIDCRTKESSDPYSTLYDCTSHTSGTNKLSQSGDSKCTVEITEASVTDMAGTNEYDPLKSVTREVKVVDSEKKCNKGCFVTITIGEIGKDNAQISKNIHHFTACPGPTIKCDQHDSVTREITCKIQVNYPFHQIKIREKNSRATLSPTSFAAVAFVSNSLTTKTISYSISDVTQTCCDLEIEFEILQVGDHSVHKVEKTFKYVLTRDEIPHVRCEPSEEKSPAIGSIIFMCKTFSKENTISLAIKETATFRIDTVKPSATTKNGLSIIENYKLTITALTIKCNQENTVIIFFNEDSADKITTVKYITTCPEPEIYCKQHDTNERKIYCDVKVPYTIEKIDVTSITQSVETNPSSRSFNGFQVDQMTTIEIPYVLKKLKSTDKIFDIEFKIYQSNNHLALTKQKKFGYVLKNEEIPHLSCIVKVPENGLALGSEKFKCTIVSYLQAVTIQTDTPGYIVTSGQVTKVPENEVAKTENHEITISSTTITCKAAVDVKLLFEDENNAKHYETVTHRTNCPEPKLEFTSHNAVTRVLILKAKIQYPFESIRLESKKSHVKIEYDDVNYDLASVSKEYTSNIKYTIKDVSKTDHTFDIGITILQSKNHVAYESQESFTYELKANEIPGIHCEPHPSSEYYISKYKCNARSKNEDIELKLDQSANFQISPEKSVGRNFFGIFAFTDLFVTLTPRIIICNDHQRVKISFQETVKHEDEVSHITLCPDPIINCHSHDVVRREIICGIRVQYIFNEIILTPSNEVALTTQSPIKYDLKYNNAEEDVKIVYSPTDLSTADHKFSIEFKIMHDGQKEAYKITKHYSYTLKVNEKPYISCGDAEFGIAKKFAENIYTCRILSKTQQLQIIDITTGYTIDPQSTDLGAADKSIYKKSDLKITIKPNDIHCNKIQLVRFSFGTGPDKVEHSLLHTTRCPELQLTGFSSPDLTSRTITGTVTSYYELESLTLETDSIAVRIDKKDTFSVTNSNGEGSASISTSFEPMDWSLDSHDFALIIKAKLKDNSIISKTTGRFTVHLTETEKPRIHCTSSTKTPNHFTESIYTCSINSRHPTFTLESKTTHFEIISQQGSASYYRHIHKYDNYEIVIKNLQIVCKTSKTIQLAFKDIPSITKDVTMTTTCEEAIINCNNHDTVNRTIYCDVSAKYPYTFEHSKTNGDISPAQIEYDHKDDDGLWTSTHVIQYELSNWLSDSKDFILKFTLKQDKSEIQHKSQTYTYILSEREFPQITCKEVLEDTKSKVTVNFYSCYIVSKTENVQIEMENDNNNKYSMTHSSLDQKTHKMEIYLRENVRIEIEDKLLICNKTVDLTLEVTDNGSKLTTIVQHTTYCHELYGGCVMNNNENNNPYIFCNFSSLQDFKFDKFKCSEVVECEKSADLDSQTLQNHEFLIDFNPRSSSTQIEFVLNITLNFSQHSQILRSYNLELTRNEVVVAGRAASKGQISASVTMIFGVIVTIFVVYQLLTRKKKNLGNLDNFSMVLE